MQPFTYVRPASLSEALAAAGKPSTQVLAGGTELLNWMRLGIVAPAQIVDISRLAELSQITPLASGGLRLGALCRLNDVAQDERIARGYPVLSIAILKAASAQIRNLATIGGNLLQRTRCPYFRAEEELPCNKRTPGSGCAAREGHQERHAIFGWSNHCIATQPSDPAVALAALDATVVATRSEGERRIPVRTFHTLPGTRPEVDHVLSPGELVTAIELGMPAPRSSYLKVRERESYEYALVSAAVALDLEGQRIRRARIALGSVAHRPWRLEASEAALAGLQLGDTTTIRKAIAASFAEARPLPGNAYKVPMAKNAAERALGLAARASA
jgi:xanthine dehydrogenase YagS FAD-binding subunit